MKDEINRNFKNQLEFHKRHKRFTMNFDPLIGTFFELDGAGIGMITSSHSRNDYYQSDFVITQHVDRYYLPKEDSQRQFFSVSIRSKLLLPTEYALLDIRRSDQSMIRSWRLEDHLDGGDWTVLAIKDDHPLEPKEIRAINLLTWEKINEFILKQKGKNKDGNDKLFLSRFNDLGSILVH